MSVGQRVSLTLFLKYSYLLGVSLQGPNTENSILDSLHSLVAAFRQGLLEPPFETSLDLEQVGSSYLNSIPLTDHSTSQVFTTCMLPIKLIESLYHGWQAIDAEQVIKQIMVIGTPQGKIRYEEDIHHPGMAKCFQDLLKGYLKGPGHPKGSDKLGVTAITIENSKNNKTLQARCFMEAIMTSLYLPIHNAKISVSHIS